MHMLKTGCQRRMLPKDLAPCWHRPGINGNKKIKGRKEHIVVVVGLFFVKFRCGSSLPLCLAFGTGEGLLWYGICVPCSKRLPGVRGAFSEAFGVKNRLLRYGRDIRCAKTASSGTRCIFKGPQNSRLHRLRTASCRSGHIFSARNGHLRYRMPQSQKWERHCLQ